MLKHKRKFALLLILIFVLSTSQVVWANSCDPRCWGHIEFKEFENQTRTGTCIHCGVTTERRIRQVSFHYCHDRNVVEIKRWVSYGSWSSWTHPCKQSIELFEMQ